MNTSQIQHLIQFPNTVTKEHQTGIAELLNSFPYFQALHALQLKSLKLKQSFRYNNALKTTAAYTTDRSILFDFITSTQFKDTTLSPQSTVSKKDLASEANNSPLNYSDTNIASHIQNTKGVLDPNLFEKAKPKDAPETAIEFEAQLETINNNSIENKLKIGQPLEFNTEESHSFNQWLKLTQLQPIQRQNTSKTSELKQNNSLKIADKPEAPLNAKLNIIDKFLEENPKIKPVDKNVKPVIVNTDDSDNESVMTETLARIYLEQNNYKKAITSYKILSLKYPEKSLFFANQIKLIQELKDYKQS